MPISRRSFLTASGLLIGSATLSGARRGQARRQHHPSPGLLLVDGGRRGSRPAGHGRGLRAEEPRHGLRQRGRTGRRGRRRQEAARSAAQGGHPAGHVPGSRGCGAARLHQGGRPGGAQLPHLRRAGAQERLPRRAHRPDHAWTARSTRCRSTSTGRTCCGTTRRCWRTRGSRAAPKSVDDFIAALDKVKGKGKIPLSIGEPSGPCCTCWRPCCSAALGTDGYNALLKPGANWGGPEVTKALESSRRVPVVRARRPADDLAARRQAGGRR